MFSLFRRQSSFGQEKTRLPRAAKPQPVVLDVEELEPRVVPATLVVTNTSDTGVSGDGSLRGEIAAAASGDTIAFASGVTGTIQLNTVGHAGQLVLNKNLTIQGPGAGSLTVQAAPNSRIFFSNTAALNLSISGLTLTGGNTTGSGNFPNGNGGAIQENADNLTLTSCTITGNTAANNVAGSQKGGGGALYAQNGTLTVSNCTISNNKALVRRGGGIYALNCPVTIQNCTITGNDSFTGSPDAGGGGGLFLKGTGTKTIIGCNISGNTANYGGGVYFKSPPAGSVVENSTFTGNKASFNAGGNPNSGGGGAVLLYDGTLTIQNCTISGNMAPNTQGGGIKVKNDSYSAPPMLPAVLTLVSTIVSGNSDVSGPNEIQRFNNALVTVNASNDLFQTAPPAGTINGTNSANITGQNPMLGALQNNGGPTFTEAIGPGSPALDAGSNPGNLATDQRGPGFTRSSGAATDIGAFEFQAIPTVTGISPTSGPAAGGTSVTITGTNFTGATSVLFGTTAAASFTVVSNTSITAVSPPGAGSVDITVTTPTATSATSAADQFTFTPAPPPPPPRGNAIFAVGADAGGGPQVNVYNATTGKLLASFYAFLPSFTGGVRVAVADLTRDGIPDIICAAGPGTSPEVRVFDGKTFQLIGDGFAFPQTFSGGVYVAAGDINGDGIPDVILGAGPGGGPEVKVVNGRNQSLLQDFYAFPVSFGGGVRVAAGDVNGDGKAEVIAAAGPGGGPEVRVFNGVTAGLLSDFFALRADFTGGIYVAAGDVNGDGKAEIITGIGGGFELRDVFTSGPGPADGPRVSVFNGTGAPLNTFFAYPQSFTGGVRVGTVLVNGKLDILTGAGPGGSPEVKVFDPLTLAVLDDFFAFGPVFPGGVFVGGG